MATVGDIYRLIDTLAPFHTQMSFDNAGFLVGKESQRVSKVLLSLDITEEVIDEAYGLGAELIISHHPVIFFPVKSITGRDPTGRKLLALAEHGIAAICAHTNLDIAEGGINDALAEKLQLHNVRSLCADGIGRIGDVQQEISLLEFASFVKEQLKAHGVRYADVGRPVRKVAVGGGACADRMGDALVLGCDTFVTSDIKYDAFLDAKARGINLLDAGHFPTENVICPVISKWLKQGFPELKIYISQQHSEVCSYI